MTTSEPLWTQPVPSVPRCSVSPRAARWPPCSPPLSGAGRAPGSVRQPRRQGDGQPRLPVRLRGRGRYRLDARRRAHAVGRGSVARASGPFDVAASSTRPGTGVDSPLRADGRDAGCRPGPLRVQHAQRLARRTSQYRHTDPRPPPRRRPLRAALQRRASRGIDRRCEAFGARRRRPRPLCRRRRAWSTRSRRSSAVRRRTACARRPWRRSQRTRSGR